MLWDNTLLQLFEKGGAAMWPLLACSVLGVALLFDRTLAFLARHGNFASFCEWLQARLAMGRVEEACRDLTGWRYPVARVAHAYLANLNRPAAERKAFAEREGSIALAALEKRLSWLGILGQVAPMLGLLGTVTGLVTAFHQIEVRHGVVQPGDLAAGIWEALITTVFGLLIAIPCLVAYHVLDQRVAKLQVQMEWVLSYLDEWTPAGAEPVSTQDAWIGGAER
jgi:biopolymer transport protein ExbB